MARERFSDGVETDHIHVYIPVDVAKELRLQAVTEEKSYSVLVTEALCAHLGFETTATTNRDEVVGAGEAEAEAEPAVSER